MVCFFQAHTALTTMGSATLLGLILVLAVVFATAAEVQSSTSAFADFARPFFPTEFDKLAQARVARQDSNQCVNQQEVLNNLPMECIALNSSVPMDPNELASYFETLCKPQCGNPLVEYLRGCTGNVIIANYYIQLCGLNSNGDICHFSNVLSNIAAVGSVCLGSDISRCCQTVQSTITNIGCCINLLNAGGIHNNTDIIKMSCSIDLPDICSESTLGGTLAPSTNETAPPNPSGTIPPNNSGTAAPYFDMHFGALTMLLTVMLQCRF